MKKVATLLIAVLMGALLPLTPATAAPAAKFLSPSPVRTGAVPELTTKGGRPVHLVAWVREAPPGALVEFEVNAVATTPPTFNTQTVDGAPAGNDTYEGFFAIPPEWADGTYQLRVGVFTADGQDEVASGMQNVTINNKEVPPPPQAESVELVDPENGGQLGFFAPKDKRTTTLLTAITSATQSADQVRAIYTKSAPGTDPEWTACGSAPVGEGGLTVVRCTLAEGDSGGSVTAVGVVANNTPWPAPPEPAADDGMDAHRVASYAAQPGSVAVTPESSRSEVSECHLLTAFVFDQFSRPIAGANVDIHASGPDDQLTFAKDDTSPITATTDPYQAPDNNHVSDKPTLTCSNEMPSEDEADVQGLHRSIGSADRIHIESVAGTEDNGGFIFALYSRTIGGTQISAWADENDDDAQSLNEASGAASLGWGQDPPPPRTEVFLDPDGPTAAIGDCQSMTVVVREGGSAVINGNVDIHIDGPDSTVAFCNPPGTTPTRRDPDSGGHVAGVHEGGTVRHAEGETDSTGRFVFGVTSSAEGKTEVLAWLDSTDDDTFQTSESSAPAEISWQPQGERSISLNASSSRVRKGRRVRLFGGIDGTQQCSAGQQVKLKARVPGGNFRTIARKNTDANGDYAFRVRVRKTKDYKAITPRNAPCEPARSGTVRVRSRG